MNAAAPAFDAVPAELLDELGDPLLWFDAGVPAQMSLKGGNAAARQLLALQVGAPARAVLAPMGARAQVADSIDALVKQVSAAARPGDHIVCMSNGGFGGAPARLLDALRI